MTYHNRPRGSNREPQMIHALAGANQTELAGMRVTACGQGLERREYTCTDLEIDVTCEACRAGLGLPPRVVSWSVTAEPDWDAVRERLLSDQREMWRRGKTGPLPMIPLDEVPWVAMWPDGEVTRHASAGTLLSIVKRRQEREAKRLEKAGRGAVVVTSVNWRDVPKGFVAPTEEDK